MDRFDCEGAPRDLGGDQGRACRSLLRARCGGAWPRLPTRARDAHLQRALRDMQRYFPHQHEQLTGMARAAGVSFSKLAAASVAALCEPAKALGYSENGRACLAVATPTDAVMRDSRAEGRFAARELTRPVLTTALLAVNESGLAAAVSGEPRAGACAAPASLLVRDCVERFDRVAAASDWCMTRPCGTSATLLLADAAGDLAAVVIAGDDRRIVLPVGNVLLPDISAASATDFAKALANATSHGSLLRETLGAFTSAHPADGTLTGS